MKYKTRFRYTGKVMNSAKLLDKRYIKINKGKK